MLNFESPNPKSNNERNLQCQPSKTANILFTSAVIAARRTEHPAQKRLPFCINNTVATAAQINLMTLIQIPRGNLRIFFKVNIARPTVFGWIEIPQPITSPSPKEPGHQIHCDFMFVLKAISALELREITLEIIKTKQLHPIHCRKQLRVMPIRYQPPLTFTHPQPLALVTKPRNRASVVHQNHISNRSNHLSTSQKKAAPDSTGRHDCTDKCKLSGRLKDGLRRASRGLLLLGWFSESGKNVRAQQCKILHARLWNTAASPLRDRALRYFAQARNRVCSAKRINNFI